MFRVMLILGVLVLVPAAIVFWRMRDRAVAVSLPPVAAQKVMGTSTVNHGDPRQDKKVIGPSTLRPHDPRPGNE